MPPDNWIYIQEPDVKIGRLQIFNNWSPALVADPDTIWLGLEYFCREGDELWSMQDGRFIDFAADELARLDLIERRDVLDGTVVRVPKAYPAYFGEYRHFNTVRDYLDEFRNLYSIGRNGMHRYNNQDHSMLSAKCAVDSISRPERQDADLGHQRRRQLPRGTRAARLIAARRTDKFCQSLTLRVTTAAMRRRFYVKPPLTIAQLVLYIS